MVKNAQVLQTAGIYTPPLNSHYTQINTSPVSDDVMRISIGQGGRVFKAITHQSNVNYIWFNKEKQFVEIWGPEKNLPDAYNRIVTRIQNIMNKVNSGELKIKENRQMSIQNKRQKKEHQREEQSKQDGMDTEE
jgi:hypothetical protein